MARSRSTFLFAAALVAIAHPARAVAAPCPASFGANLEREFKPWLAQRAAAGSFSGVVLVACDGRNIFSAAHGVADRSTGRPVTMDTRFNLGSMNKMWTAIAVAQLVEQGKIDLDAPVGRYLPDLANPALRDSVLVRHLLSHTAGTGSYFTRGFLRNHVFANAAADYLPYFVPDPLDFRPGERMQYSNAGFALLGAIVERVSGENVFTYMPRAVLARAGMTTASYADLRRLSPDMAVGYAMPPGAEAPVPNTPMLEQHGSPAGGAYATAADVLAFSRALWGGRLVRPDLVATFTQPRVPMGPSMHYGYGFGVGEVGGWRLVGHNGGAPGVGTEFVSFPDQGLDIIVLTNVEMPEATNVVGRMIGVLQGRAPVTAAMAPEDQAAPAPARSASPAVERTRAWLAATAAGLEAYTTFVTDHFVPVADRTPRERAEATMRMLDRVGRLTLRRVVREGPDGLVAEVIGDKAPGTFTLTVTMEPTAPYRLTLVNLQPNR